MQLMAVPTYQGPRAEYKPSQKQRNKHNKEAAVPLVSIWLRWVHWPMRTGSWVSWHFNSIHSRRFGTIAPPCSRHGRSGMQRRFSTTPSKLNTNHVITISCSVLRMTGLNETVWCDVWNTDWEVISGLAVLLTTTHCDVNSVRSARFAPRWCHRHFVASYTAVAFTGAANCETTASQHRSLSCAPVYQRRATRLICNTWCSWSLRWSKPATTQIDRAAFHSCRLGMRTFTIHRASKSAWLRFKQVSTTSGSMSECLSVNAYNCF